MNAALLPEELLDTEPRTLAELQNGETGHIIFTDLVVKADRTCFLDLNGRLREKVGTGKIQVSRDESGNFHVIVPAGRKCLVSKSLPSNMKLQPVASISIGPAER